MPEPEPHDVLASLHQVFIKAGWLVDMEVMQTVWGPRITLPRGMGLDHVQELVLTIEAGIQARVIKR